MVKKCDFRAKKLFIRNFLGKFAVKIRKNNIINTRFMSNRFLVGFDVGSSSVKASLVNADSGKCVSTAFFPEKEAPIMAVKTGWAEQNPESWWKYAKQALQKIMAEGLKNAGDASSGSIRRNPSVSKTVSHCEDMFHTAMNLKGSYKGSTGAILVAIPSEYLDEDGDVLPGMEEKVYNTDKNGVSVIKPEYLMGFMQSLGEGTTMKFKTRDEILEASRVLNKETEE